MSILVALALWLLAAPEDRVEKARQERAEELRELFARAGVRRPAREIYLRAFKEEEELELWAGEAGKPLALLRTYRICARSGQLGPKRARGDLQVPEGFYRIDRFNPTSAFHLSLGSTTPTPRTGRAGEAIPAGTSSSTAAAPPSAASPSRTPRSRRSTWWRGGAGGGPEGDPVHVFPRRLGQGALEALEKQAGDPALAAFWRELEPAYRSFEESRRPPRISVAPGGAYVIKPSRAAPAPSAQRRTRP